MKLPSLDSRINNFRHITREQLHSLTELPPTEQRFTRSHSIKKRTYSNMIFLVPYDSIDCLFLTYLIFSYSFAILRVYDFLSQ